MLKALVVFPHSVANGNSLQCSVLCTVYLCVLKNPAMA